MAFKMRSNSSVALKICGITSVEQAKEIAELGVDAIGVIGVEGSVRFVEEIQRRHIFAKLKKDYPNIQRVWVTADKSSSALIAGLKGNGSPTTIQLHGNESPEKCSQLRIENPNLNWWKACRIKAPEDIQKAMQYQGRIDALLLDAWSPIELGGTGKRLPLEWIKASRLEGPWWLAGGISAEYVPEILNQVRPFGLDASSKLEISPGIKNIDLVNSLAKVLGK